MQRFAWQNDMKMNNYHQQLQAWQQAAQQQAYAQQQAALQYWQQANEQRQQIPGMLPMEQSFIENILRLNRGKMATVYMTFENNSEWNAKIFRGRIEAAGRDHIVISNPETGVRYLLLMVNLDYITFDEPLTYEYPYNTGQQSLTTAMPR